LTSQSINDILGCSIFFKCENFQKVGAFKFRGASNAVLSLNEKQSRNGVATHSSGNHAQALALAGSMRNIPSYIVMPDNSPKVKSDAVAGYGGNIIYCKPTLEARESTLEKVVKETGAEFIHPYNNFNVICGQGTAALELLREIKELDIVMTPVGGGGLLSGTSISVKALSPNTLLLQVNQGADDALNHYKKEKLFIIESQNYRRGLLTSLEY